MGGTSLVLDRYLVWLEDCGGALEGHFETEQEDHDEREEEVLASLGRVFLLGLDISSEEVVNAVHLLHRLVKAGVESASIVVVVVVISAAHELGLVA